MDSQEQVRRHWEEQVGLLQLVLDVLPQRGSTISYGLLFGRAWKKNTSTSRQNDNYLAVKNKSMEEQSEKLIGLTP